MGGGGLSRGRGQMSVGFGIGELDGADAAEVVKVAGDIRVGGGQGEVLMVMRDEKVCLRDVRRRGVVAEEKDGSGGLSLGVLAEDGGSERGEKVFTDVVYRGLARGREWLEGFVKEL